MGHPEMYWLPVAERWLDSLRAQEALPSEELSWDGVRSLSTVQLDFLQTNRLDRLLQRLDGREPAARMTPVRLAILGSCSVAHLAPAIRVALLRRGIPAAIHVVEYGQQQHELLTPGSALANFVPTHTLFVHDAHHLVKQRDPGATTAEAVDRALSAMREAWRQVRALGGSAVLQQTPLQTMVPLGGSNEHRVPRSKHHFIAALTAAMQGAADEDGVDLVAAGQQAARDGLHAWHNPALYLKAKYDISPDAAPMYGELVARLVAARAGLASKCLVLDLDNTLWGGVIGDDGPAGIVLGQGSARGEAFAAFQDHVRDLGRRGIILAVCSKNDETVARAAFRDHPEMVLREDDIACFVANWQDKPANLRAIARQLNIGLDSLVFADDNPFERSLVRQELPMVGVPELGTEPALYARTLADAGYFEAVMLTEEDAVRSRAYRENTLRDQARESATDMRAYLLGLNMRLRWRRFDDVGLQRIVQLINKTNQFNLTTQRTTVDATRENMGDPGFIGLQLRLVDRFGDNGIIAIVAGRTMPGGVFAIETWLMSCRVLGRHVEQATLQVLAGEAAALGCTALAGLYRPSPRNGMVAGLYPSLQFQTVSTHPDGDVAYRLALPITAPAIDIMTIEEAL